jgi:hypothetical protein
VRVKAEAFAAKDTYLDLVKRFPLRRLRSRADHPEAIAVLARVFLERQGTRDRVVLDSEMLSGRRDFSKAAISKLCVRFGLNPAVLF